MSLADPNGEPAFWLDAVVDEYLNTMGHRGAHARETRRLYSLLQAIAICPNHNEVVRVAADMEGYLRDGLKGTTPVTLVPRKDNKVA